MRVIGTARVALSAGSVREWSVRASVRERAGRADPWIGMGRASVSPTGGEEGRLA
ncbi:hypothetical protein [Salana multivorans]